MSLIRDRARRHAHHTLHRVEEEVGGYDDAGRVPLHGYAGSLVAFAASVAGLALAGRRSGASLPERYSVSDIAIGGIATHKFTRLLSKGSVTSPLRAPFTEFEAPAGSAEHHEQARGGGVRHTIGELLTCPFCLGQWVGTGYVVGLALAPRPARTWAAVFAVTGVSDALQQVYARLRVA
ncbi:MAG TPA: DUF1360 domain-containing protein [Nocardioidaceae bacterium]|jgi:hypothetical protein